MRERGSIGVPGSGVRISKDIIHSLRAPEIEAQLRTGLAMGADRAIRVDPLLGSDLRQRGDPAEQHQSRQRR